ncbi:MAG: nucleotidyltransferase domain-containing protein, partial [Endomicrobium sp.]|nr:nucleotidyltransferase domain-containing protein [Endomicrobium sp.]
MAKNADLIKARKAVFQYADYLKTKMKVKRVYLFGSYAKNEYKQDSDIDVAVVSDVFKDDPVDDFVMLSMFGYDIDSRIEPHPFLIKDFNKGNP